MLAEEQTRTPRGGTRLRTVPVEEFDPELRELVAADDRTPLPARPAARTRPPAISRQGDRRTPRGVVDRPAAPRPPARARPPADCVLQPVPHMHGDPLSRRGRRRAHRGARTLTGESPTRRRTSSAAEQAAIRYGELLAIDHLTIDGSVYDDLREHFTEEEIWSSAPTARSASASGGWEQPGTWSRSSPSASTRVRSPLLGAARRSPFADPSGFDEAKPRSVFSKQFELPAALVGAHAAAYVTDRHGIVANPAVPCGVRELITSSPSSPSSAIVATRGGGAPLARSPDGSAGRQGRGCKRRGSSQGRAHAVRLPREGAIR